MDSKCHLNLYDVQKAFQIQSSPFSNDTML